MFELVLLDDQVAVVAGPLETVVLDPDVLIPLRVHEDLLCALLVLQTDFVETPAALGAVGLQGALGLLVRQRIGRAVGAVVDAAGDDGPVGIALEEIDDHFLADARDLDGAPAGAGPGTAGADPAGAFLVGLALAVPVELHLHPAVFVGVDLLALGPDHDGGLGTLDHRLAA